MLRNVRIFIEYEMHFTSQRWMLSQTKTKIQNCREILVYLLDPLALRPDETRVPAYKKTI